MAYQVSRQKRITETLELLDDKGNVAESVDIDINIDKSAKTINKAVNDVTRAKELSDTDPNKMQAVGEAVLSLFVTVFGEEQTQKIVDFYENRTVEMLTEVLPFIRDVILVRIKEACDVEKKKFANNFKLNRETRRKLGI